MQDDAELLRQHGIHPSAQRVAVAEYVLHTDAHPSADEVYRQVTERFSMLSRATVYNTLNLFVKKGLLRELALTEGRVVFDPTTSQHHHMVDAKTGAIYDVPWGALEVSGVKDLDGFEVDSYQVVMRGTKAGRSRRAR